MAQFPNKPIRSRVLRWHLDEVIYFITTVTLHRKQIFRNSQHIELLRKVLRDTQTYHPFGMRGYAFLHEHLHFLVYLPKGTDISKLMQSFKRTFTKEYKDLYEITESTHLWQPSFYDHVIRDRRDYINHLNYIHYNPVKHGYVNRPEDYLHTSYSTYFQRGYYETGWGHYDEPYDDNLRDGRTWEWGE